MSEDSDRAKTKPPSVDRLSQLWRRINDHKMVQWSVAYVALAYGLQHGVILTSESLEWPNAVARISMLLLALGLPVVMTFAWYHGERASRRISGPELTIISILLVIGSLFFYVAVRPSEQIAAGTAPAAVQSPAVGGLPASAVPGISVAVLPFVNLSSDKEQEFFSDGMTEEITSALAKVMGLTVIGRTSAFQFKGANKDLRSIGQALGATHLIEGSVRKAGNRLRITAQLIRADTAAHLWTENYDRELTDVFAIQEDIAQAIAGALQVPLGLKQGETLVSNRTGDLDSYQQYLRARALYRDRSVDESIRVLEPVVARDPGFAPAWAQLARSYNLQPNYSPVLRSDPIDKARRSVESMSTKAEMAAREAIRLDPRYAGGYSALADVRTLTGKWAEAEDLFRQALALDANDPDALSRYSVKLIVEGRLKQAVAVAERVRLLEPLVPTYQRILAGALQLNGQNQASIPILESTSSDGPASYYRNVYLARAYAAAGDYAKSADTLLLITGNQVSRHSVEEAAALIRTAPAKAKAPSALPLLEGELDFVYAHVGALDRVLDYPERGAVIGFWGQSILESPWYPPFAPIRKTERFKALMRKAGLVDYWRAKGWPDLCHAAGTDDFACN